MPKQQLPPDQKDDHRLIEGLKTGNNTIIDDIYARYFPIVKALVLKHSGTADQAQDLFQDTLTAIFYNTQKPHFDLSCSFKTYLYSVCRNLWLKHLRQQNMPFVSIQEDTLVVNPDEIAETCQQFDQYQLFRACLKKMDQQCQKVLKLFMQGKSMKTIAHTMGYGSAGYARKRKTLCKKKLISIIEAHPAAKTMVGTNKAPQL